MFTYILISWISRFAIFISLIMSSIDFIKLIFKTEIDHSSEDKISNIYESFLISECSYSTTGQFQPLPNIKFSILNLNCRSLRKNISSILQLLANTNCLPSVIAITETWLYPGDELF